jgi:diacylglycerol kinase (ATP)
MPKILYIVNRNPFRGHGNEIWKRFCSLWPEEIRPEDVIMTKRAGHARDIAAGCGDYDIIASFGGDGTASDILSGIMERDEPRPAMAIFPGGSTNIMTYNLGIRSVEDAIALLRDGHTRLFNVMRIDCRVNGNPAYKYSFLACNAGFAAVSYRMLGPWMERLFGPKIGRYLRAIAGMIMYKPTRMTVRHEGREYSDYTKAILIGNTEWILKDNVQTTPGIDPDNGDLNVTIIPAQTKIRDFSNISKIAVGGGIKEKGVLYFLTKKSEIESDPPADLAIDGEFFGATPAVITLCPRAVRVISPRA